MTLSILGSFVTLSITVLCAILLIVTFYCYDDDYSGRKLASNIKRLNVYNYRTTNDDEKNFITLTPYTVGPRQSA
jgi:hypothetical protein